MSVILFVSLYINVLCISLKFDLISYYYIYLIIFRGVLFYYFLQLLFNINMLQLKLIVKNFENAWHHDIKCIGRMLY